MELFDLFYTLAQTTSQLAQSAEVEVFSWFDWISLRTNLLEVVIITAFTCFCGWWKRSYIFRSVNNLWNYITDQYIRVPKKPLPDKVNFGELVNNGEDLLADYGAAWKRVYEDLNTSDRENLDHSIPLKYRSSIKRLRLDTYLWPEIAWRTAIPKLKPYPDAQSDGDQNDTLDSSWISVPGKGEAAVLALLQQLRRDRLMVLYDRAGMGKTAFTHQLCRLLISANQANSPLAGLTQPDQRLLVVRLEGTWPRNAQGEPLDLIDLLSDEILALRIGGERIVSSLINGDDVIRINANRQILKQSLPRWLRQGRVFVILDAFDQMQEEDRNAAITQIEIARKTQDLDNCHWLVIGRPYSLRPYVRDDSLITEDVYRVRLRPFNVDQQDAYFVDVEGRLAQSCNLFFAEKSRLLDQVCPDRDSISSDLGVPWHLSMVRRLIESNLSQIGDAAAYLLPRIENTGQLHLIVSDEALKRAIERASSIDFGDSSLETKVRMLRRVCGVLAWQMMLDENYNAMIRAGTNLTSYQGVHSHEIVTRYLDRCHARYLANRAQANAPAAEKDWAEAIELLKRIEVTDFSDLDVFNAECRAFRSRKTMEWYAAHFLMNHATEHDLTRPCPDAGAKSGKNFVGNGNWDGCWKLAIDLPDNAVTHSFVASALGILFGQPGLGQNRPAELMYRAWERWLEPKTGTPLEAAHEIIANYRQQIDQIAGESTEKAQIVDRLRFDAQRDRPDESLTDPNKTETGWYRRIPPEGESATFKRMHQRVTVSMFWMRKFPITNDEYRLFDPNHQNPWGQQFDGLDQPVIAVDWYMAVMFARWLGPGYRLPTEAEWEAASRAGTTTELWFSNIGKDLPKHGWFFENAGSRTHRLRESQDIGGHENPLGLYDMHGNVKEWCQDRSARYGDRQEATNPIGLDSGSDRIARGGSWSDEASLSRAVSCSGFPPMVHGSNLGFRLLLSPSKGPPEARG